MAVHDRLKDDYDIIKSDKIIPLYWIIGFMLVISGYALIKSASPDLEGGFACIAIGFAIVIIGLNKFSNAESKKKMTEIQQTLNKMEKDLQDLKDRH
jgi:uncharacterized membrane protein